jgi:hypothetical protein
MITNLSKCVLFFWLIAVTLAAQTTISITRPSAGIPGQTV